MYKIDPCPLTLIDGSTNHLVESVVPMPIELDCGYSCQIKCYVMELKGTYPLVLGHDWLVKHNPAINWRENTLYFSLSTQEQQTSTKQPICPRLLDPRKEILLPPNISFINALAYYWACKEEGVRAYQCHEPPLWLSPFLLFFSLLFSFLFIAWESLSHYVTQGVTMSHHGHITVTVTRHVTRHKVTW